MRIRGLVALLALLTLASAGAAQAKSRYASPTGEGTACEQAAPCSAITAYREAQGGDEVILAGGTYELQSESLFVISGKPGVTIRGNPAEPPPLIVGSPTSSMLSSYSGTVEYLRLENQGPYDALYCSKCTVDRVVAATTGPNTWAAEGNEGSIVRDSLLIASGHEATGFWGVGNATGPSDALINDTVIATGTGSFGVKSHMGGPGGHLVEMRNTIVSGEGTDLLGEETTPGDVGEISAKSSSYDKSEAKSPAAILDEGGNQTAAPIFVNAATGDFHEAAGSPTIDAGVAGALGPLDLGGSPRVQGGGVDIGAYEYTPPPPVAQGGVRSISIKPKRFRKKARVTYTMSGPATVVFSVSRKLAHGKSYRPVKGSFSLEGKTGTNSFVFNGRIGGKALKPGRYKLTADAGHLVSAAFEIAGPPKHRHRRG